MTKRRIVDARDDGKAYDAQILCSANAGEAYDSSTQYARTKAWYYPGYPPHPRKGRYADLICRQVDEDLIS